MLKARTIILASPVYWYSMSAQMKIFFDRLTDLTDLPYKPIGKQLAGKTMYAVATGSRDAPPFSFSEPFSETAGYFKMEWGGLLYRRGSAALTREDRAAARFFAEDICALA
jgi:multimeric flavodoxin WrbA